MTNSIKKIGIICIAIIMIASLIGTGLLLHFNRDIPTSASADYQTTATMEKNNTSVDAMKNSILLVDRSGSTDGMTTISSNYEKVENFSSGLGVIGGYSEIAEALNEVLTDGYRRIGIATDCEQYHADGRTDWSALSGRFENVEILVFLAENYEENDVQNAIESITSVIDTSNCTFKVFNSDGSLYANVCENFDYLALEEKSPITVTSTYHTECIEGNSVPFSMVVIVIEVFFLVICIFAILLLALVGNNTVAVSPGAVSTAIQNSDAVLLDGSGSVASIYKKFLEYCEQNGKHSVIRFATDVKEMALEKAKKLSAEGRTSGYEAMKLAFDKGYRIVTIVSDGEFNDDVTNADGVIFDEIYFIGVGLTEANIEHLKSFGRSYKIIAL